MPSNQSTEIACPRTAPAEHPCVISCYNDILNAYGDAGELNDSLKVVVASILVGPIPSKIYALTGLQKWKVRQITLKLYDMKFWLPNYKIAISSDIDDPQCDKLITLELLMLAMEARGIINRVREPTPPYICVDCGKPKYSYTGKRCRDCYLIKSKILSFYTADATVHAPSPD